MTSATLTGDEQLQLVVEHCRCVDALTAPVARQCRLFRTTLYGHMRGSVRTPGSQPAFSTGQEKVFVQHLLTLRDWLVPIYVKQLILYVDSFLRTNRVTVKMLRNNKAGKNWVYRFSKTHSDCLTRRWTVNISPWKVLMETNVLHAFFDRFKLQLTGDAAFMQHEVQKRKADPIKWELKLPARHCRGRFIR